MTAATSWVDAQTEIATKLGLVVPNEFLFTVFYLVNVWSKPISSIKLAKDLGASEQLVRDHLNLLVKLGLSVKQGQKYRSSELGMQGFTFINQSVRKEPSPSLMTVNSDNVTEVFIGMISAAPQQEMLAVETKFGGVACEMLPADKTTDAAETKRVFSEDTVAAHAA